MLKLPDPIVADDGTFVGDIDIFKYGINEWSFDVIAMTKVAWKESDDLVRTYEYDPIISPLKMTLFVI